MSIFVVFGFSWMYFVVYFKPIRMVGFTFKAIGFICSRTNEVFKMSV